MENLTKQNFLNRFKKGNPLAISHFKNWLEDYKNEIDWNDIFKFNVDFDDIPIEMQLGLLMRYFEENVDFPVGNLFTRISNCCDEHAEHALDILISDLEIYMIMVNGMLEEQKKRKIVENN